MTHCAFTIGIPLVPPVAHLCLPWARPLPGLAPMRDPVCPYSTSLTVVLVVALISVQRGCSHLDLQVRVQLRPSQAYLEESKPTLHGSLRASPQRLPRVQEITCWCRGLEDKLLGKN